jgi:Icc-related predicted phosphoesterase
MRVVIAADPHGDLPVVPPCDLLLLPGDYNGRGLEEPAAQAVWLDTVLRAWLESVPAAAIAATGGNRDYALFRDRSLADSLPWSFLVDERATVGGLEVYGTPWTPPFGKGWAWKASETRLMDVHYPPIPDEIDVLLSHGPPFGLGDLVRRRRSGSSALRTALDRLVAESGRLSLLACGHLHEGRGVEYHPSGVAVANGSIEHGQVLVVDGDPESGWREVRPQPQERSGRS